MSLRCLLVLILFSFRFEFNVAHKSNNSICTQRHLAQQTSNISGRTSEYSSKNIFAIFSYDNNIGKCKMGERLKNHKCLDGFANFFFY